MQIVRNITTNGNTNTELLNILNSIPESHLFHKEHPLRHPLAIYSISTQRVFNAFNKVIESLEKSKDHNEITERHQELIESLNSYIDDGYHLMKCLFPKNSVNKNIIFADKWLKSINISVKKIIDDYQSKLSPYRDRIAKINNKVKHNHARYCTIEVSTLHGKIKGYYIEGVNLNEVIIPDNEIHPSMKDGTYTAISYNMDLKRLLVYFYIISDLISKTIYKLYSFQNNTNLIIKLTPDSSSVLNGICEKIALLPDLFFPDEYVKDIPLIIIRHNGKEIELRENAHTKFINKLRRYTKCKVSTGITFDGISQKWALPYLLKKPH